MKGIGKNKQDAEECLRGLQRQRRRQGSAGRTMSEEKERRSEGKRRTGGEWRRDDNRMK